MGAAPTRAKALPREQRQRHGIGHRLIAGHRRVEMVARIIRRQQPVGPRRIALEVSTTGGRLVLDGEVGPPPYLTGISLPGRLHTDTGADEVKVWIAPAQLLELWFRLNL